MRRVYVGQAPHVEKEELRECFEKFGHILNIWVARNPPGFGFVTFETPEEANRAIQEGNGLEIHGDRILVELARDVGSLGGAQG